MSAADADAQYHTNTSYTIIDPTGIEDTVDTTYDGGMDTEKLIPVWIQLCTKPVGFIERPEAVAAAVAVASSVGHPE